MQSLNPEAVPQPSDSPTLPVLPKPERMNLVEQIRGNQLDPYRFFDRHSVPTKVTEDLLLALPLPNRETGTHIATMLKEGGRFTLPEVEALLQETFFRPNQAKFSFQIGDKTTPATPEQSEIFRRHGFLDAVTVMSGGRYDVGVIFGGTVQAMESRAGFLLKHAPKLSTIALLGGRRAALETEKGDALARVIGADLYNELEAKGELPQIETDLLKAVWEMKCREKPELRTIKLVTIDSALRPGEVKQSPGTPETVRDLLAALERSVSLGGPRACSFLLSSSQPYAHRQREDFISNVASLNYQDAMQVDVIGYAPQTTPNITALGVEVAKMVHAQFLTRY